MVPKKIKFVDHIPMTMNGKADRRALAEMLKSSQQSSQSKNERSEV
jgi:acyl-coenzyme A synthetase/AMP-(fatty) acid ligase